MSLCLFKRKCCVTAELLRLLFKPYTWGVGLGSACWAIPTALTFPVAQVTCTVGMCAPPAVPSAAVSSRAGPVFCPLLPGQTGGHCQSSFLGCPAGDKWDTSSKVHVAASTLEHSLDSCGKTKVPHTNSCSCTKNGGVFNTSLHKGSQSWSCKALGF